MTSGQHSHDLSTNQELLDAVLKGVQERRNDSAFMERLARSLERNRPVLDGLADEDGGDWLKDYNAIENHLRGVMPVDDEDRIFGKVGWIAGRAATAVEQRRKLASRSSAESGAGAPTSLGQDESVASRLSAPRQSPAPDAERIARAFHRAYELLAPRFGYRTREASAKDWDEVPEANRLLMMATVNQLLIEDVIMPADAPPSGPPTGTLNARDPMRRCAYGKPHFAHGWHGGYCDGEVDAPADDVPAGVHPEAAEYQRGWQAGFAHAKAIAPEPPPTDVADVMFGFINLYWNAERFRGSDPSIDASLDRAKALLFAPPAGSAVRDEQESVDG